MTLHAGGDLRIGNVTGGYLGIDAAGDGDDRLGDGNGLPIGEEHRITFSTAGTYTVVAGGATITVDVVE